MSSDAKSVDKENKMEKNTIRRHMKERWGSKSNIIENPPLPNSLNIEINNTCNQKCIFCPFHGKYAPKKMKLSMIPVEKVKMILDEAKRVGIGEKEVGFYLTGEAFLHKDLADIIAYAKQLGFKYTFLTTNGAEATPDKMKKVLDAGLDSIRFSINATDREMYEVLHGKDDFEKVIENIKFMQQYIKEKKLNVATSISCVLTKKTLHIEEKMKEMFGEYVDDIIFIPVLMNRLVCDQKFWDEYNCVDDSDAQIDSEFVCSILFNTMYINANFEVVPCCEVCDSEIAVYDLNKKFDLVEAWNCSGMVRLRNIFLSGADDKDTVCENCMLRRKGVGRLLIDN